jgi:hypothetical protein
VRKFGHGDHIQNNFKMVASDYTKEPVKPTLDAEPCYEDHPRGFKSENGFFDVHDVRVAAYYSVFAGGLGVTYGHHSIWSMTTEPGDYFIMDWQTAILRPGGAQVQYVRKLIESRPFLERVPDQSLIVDNIKGANYVAATRGNSYAFLYSPNGLYFKLQMGIITGESVKSCWYNPRNGEVTEGDVIPNRGVVQFIPPSSGRGEDCVLILDDATSRQPNYKVADKKII